MSDTKLMKVAEVAAELACSPWTVRDLIRARRIAFVRVGVGSGRIRITREALNAYIESRTTGAA